MDKDKGVEKERMRVVVLSGAGISAASGLRTFRDAGGLWENHRIEEVATPEAWVRNPDLVLGFYNERRRQLRYVSPNAAHREIASWERVFEVDVVTQNVDDLHERAGSSRVLHLHGKLTEARSSLDAGWVIDIGYRDIGSGERCPDGSLLRPNIVWFGEEVPMMGEAADLVSVADVLVVVGTSLAVYPAASLVDWARPSARCFYVDPAPARVGRNFEVIAEPAEVGVLKLRGRLEELAAELG